MLRFAVAASLALLPVTASASDVTTVGSMDEFKTAFCAVEAVGAHIFVVPVGVFKGGSVSCPVGEFTLRVTEPADDAGHGVYNVDPPAGVDAAFDCDAKADLGMQMIALNCLPAGAETADHTKT